MSLSAGHSISTRKRRGKVALYIGTSLTVLLGIGFSIEHFFDNDHYNPGFYEFPLVISLHVAPGGLYLALVIFQLTSRIRRDQPWLHHVVGWFTVGLGLISGAMAVTATVLFPFSGQAMIFFVAPFACYFVFALVRGFWCARHRNFIQHRKWMIRAFAIATAIATQRLILVPALILFGTQEETIRLASMMAFTSAFALHLCISEYWLHRTRQQPVG